MQNTVDEIYYYLEAVWKRRWTLVIPIVLCTAIGAAVGFNVPSYFRSTTLILVEKQQVPETYVTPTDRTPFSQRLNTISQQIISRQNLEKIIADFRLYQDISTVNPLAAMLKKAGLKIKTDLTKEEILERMTNDIEVKVIGDRRAGDAFSITYTGISPEIAMEVTNKLASLFIEENLKVREQYAEGTSDFLASELESAKKELEAQEKSVRAFKERNMGTLPQQLEANLRTLDRLQTELQTTNFELKNAEDRKMILEGQLSQGGAAAGVPGTGPTGNPMVDELRRLQNELAALLSVYNENYPDVIITKKRINELKELLAKSKPDEKKDTAEELRELRPEERNPEVYNNLLAVKSQIDTLKRRQADILKQIKIFEARVEATPGSEQRYSDLRRDYDISIRNYQALLEKKLSAKLAENLEKRQKGERFRVIDPANLPERPYKPVKIIFTMAGFAIGTGIGLGTILLLEFINPAFRRPDEFADITAMPVLAVIPALSTGGGEGKPKKIPGLKNRKTRAVT